MAEQFLRHSQEPIPITLANWGPKKNAEGETRLRLDFELPLTDAVLELCPKSVKACAKTIGVHENGVTESKISADFMATLETFETGGHTIPDNTFSACLLSGLHVFRPTQQEGSVKELYLTFSTTIRVEGPEGGQIAAWALKKLKETIFLRAHEVQPSLPGMGDDEPEPKPKRQSGKDAAAGKD